MPDATHQAEEIAESFVNGNRSWVRQQIRGSRKQIKLTLAVRALLAEWGQNCESFDRCMADE